MTVTPEAERLWAGLARILTMATHGIDDDGRTAARDALHAIRTEVVDLAQPDWPHQLAGPGPRAPQRRARARPDTPHTPFSHNPTRPEGTVEAMPKPENQGHRGNGDPNRPSKMRRREMRDQLRREGKVSPPARGRRHDRRGTTATPTPLEVELNPDGYTIHLVRGPYGADLDPGDIPDLMPGARRGAVRAGRVALDESELIDLAGQFVPCGHCDRWQRWAGRLVQVCEGDLADDADKYVGGV